MTRLSSSWSIDADTFGRELRGKVAERVGERGPNAPVPIGLHAREHGNEALVIDRGRGAQAPRRASPASRRSTGPGPSAGRPSTSACRAPSTASRRTLGCAVGVARQGRDRCRRPPSRRSGRAHGSPATVSSSPDFAAGSRSASSGFDRRRVLQRAEAARRERAACSGPWTAAAAAAPARHADPRRAAARRRPATTATPAGRRRQHAAASGSYAFRRTSANSPSLNASASGAMPPPRRLAAIAATGALVAYSRHHLADRSGRALRTDEAQGFGGAAAHERQADRSAAERAPTRPRRRR